MSDIDFINVDPCCRDWNPNVMAIHQGLTAAALNGTPTKLTKQFEYCPWCGLKLSDRKNLNNS